MPSANNLPDRACEVCGSVFTPKHNRSRYCRKQCLWKSKNDRYKQQNPEKVRATARAMYEKHREKRVISMRERYANNRPHWKALNDKSRHKVRTETPWRHAMVYARARAKKKNLPFDLTEAWALTVWTGVCSVSKLSFVTGELGPGPKPRTPSIDRINPKLGYVQSNCRFVIHAVNGLKGSGTDEDMMEVVRNILLHST